MYTVVSTGLTGIMPELQRCCLHGTSGLQIHCSGLPMANTEKQAKWQEWQVKISLNIKKINEFEQ